VKYSLFERNPIKTQLVILCITLILIEISLRLFKESTALLIGNPFAKSIQYTPITDEFTHHITNKLPNTTRLTSPGVGDTFEPAFNVINSFGMRGDELKAKDYPRVLFVGDSFIEADEVAFEDTFSERLNREFDGQISFLAHGVTSWAPTTEFSWIFHKGMLLKPDEVYLFLCWNDFFPEETYVQSDEVYRKEAIWREGVPFRYLYPDARHKYESPRIYKIEQKIESVLSQSELVKLIYRGILNISSYVNPPLTALEIMTIFSTDANKWPVSLRRNIDKTINVITMLDQYLKNNDVKLAVTLIPNPTAWQNEVLAAKNFEAWTQYINDLGLEPNTFIQSQQGLESYLQKRLMNKGIDWFDLLEGFNNVKRTKEILLYNQADGHWNKFGHEVVFEIIKKRYY